MGKWEHEANFIRELGIKADFREQFGISFKGTLKIIFGNKGALGNFTTR